jgi:ribosome maturation factor RimP
MGWQQAVERTVSGMGYELVDIERSTGGLLRVTIDRVPGQVYAEAGEAVTVEDCERLTRQLQAVLEVEGQDYQRLEVSSPGLDRPLRSAADWPRFAGQLVRVTLHTAFQGRKHWQGVLQARDGGWRLVLPPPEPVSRPGHRPKARPAADAPQQVLDFTLDEVREARLQPVLDFKGRRSAPLAPETEETR